MKKLLYFIIIGASLISCGKKVEEEEKDEPEITRSEPQCAVDRYTLKWEEPSFPVIGYRVYFGPKSNRYTDIVEVRNRNINSVTIDDLRLGSNIFFKLMALDERNNERLVLLNGERELEVKLYENCSDISNALRQVKAEENNPLCLNKKVELVYYWDKKHFVSKYDIEIGYRRNSPSDLFEKYAKDKNEVRVMAARREVYATIRATGNDNKIERSEKQLYKLPKCKGDDTDMEPVRVKLNWKN